MEPWHGTDDDGLVVRINTVGTTSSDFEADKSIVTSKTDSRHRRTIKVERSKLSTSWGFTLQSYGIYNKTLQSIEHYTYVDYIEYKSPAFMAGMRKGDIIFAVNGQSTEDLSHEDMVEKVKSCKMNMRLVIVNTNICEKIELHQRRQKLQTLLRQKQAELKSLEKREMALIYNCRVRFKAKQSSLISLESSSEKWSLGVQSKHSSEASFDSQATGCSSLTREECSESPL